MAIKKPKILRDWDENRRIVVTPTGERIVLFKERAEEVYEAGMRVYKRHKEDEKKEKEFHNKLKKLTKI